MFGGLKRQTEREREREREKAALEKQVFTEQALKKTGARAITKPLLSRS